MKKCNKCKIEKPNFEFSKDSKSKDKLYCHCKSCVKEYYASYYEKNKEEVNKKNKIYKTNNQEYFTLYSKQYFQKNKKEIIDKKTEKRNRSLC